MSVSFSPYGAFELKQKYQRNMFMGTMFALLLVVVVIGGTYIYRALTAEEVVGGNVQIIKTIADLGPPPTVAKKTAEDRYCSTQGGGAQSRYSETGGRR